MKIDIRTGCACAALLVALAWSADADAQRSPWWERQKAASAESTGAPAQGQAAVPAAPAPQYTPDVQRETIEGPAYTYVEAGVGRVDVELGEVDERVSGGYVRGSVAVADNLYVFGGHDQVSETWSLDAERLKATIDQTELGLGASVSLSPRTDFISELSLVRLGVELDYDDAASGDSLSGSDHVYAGKLVLGIRARPVSGLELWAKAGYLRVDDNLVVDHSMVGNLGLQYRLTQTWGLVGEAEFYEDVRFYRLGVRASF